MTYWGAVLQMLSGEHWQSRFSFCAANILLLPQIDPSNLTLLEQHLSCAAAESPLIPEEDEHYFGPKLAEAADFLVREGTNMPLQGRRMCCSMCVFAPGDAMCDISKLIWELLAIFPFLAHRKVRMLA